MILTDSAVFGYDESVSGVLFDGAFFGIVEEDEQISFPFASDDLSHLFPADGYRIDDIGLAANRATTIDVVHLGPLILRADDTEGLALRGIDVADLVPFGE